MILDEWKFLSLEFKVTPINMIFLQYCIMTFTVYIFNDATYRDREIFLREIQGNRRLRDYVLLISSNLIRSNPFLRRKRCNKIQKYFWHKYKDLFKFHFDKFFPTMSLRDRYSKILFPFKLLQITIITIDKYTCNYTRVLEKDLGFNGATLFPTWNRRLAVNLVSESSVLLNEVARGEKLSFDSREQKYTRGKVNGKKLLPRLRR